jgi:hypothetical protein
MMLSLQYFRGMIMRLTLVVTSLEESVHIQTTISKVTMSSLFPTYVSYY